MLLDAPSRPGSRASGAPRRAARPARPRILLTTEGTYPYAVGGVSSWCDLLLGELTEFDWLVLPIVAAHGRPPAYRLPDHAREVERIELWSEALPPRRWAPRDGRGDGAALPGVLVRGLL